MGNHWTVSMRPRTLNELYGCDNIKKFFGKKKVEDWPTAILLQGCFGNSKTSTALIMASMLTCLRPKDNRDPCLECENCKTILNETYNRGNVKFIDGAQSSKDEVIKEVEEYLQGAPFGSPRKVIIIDEAQELSTSAQKSLLKILETPRKNVHIILTSMGNTDGSVKSGSGKEVPKSIVSRCQTFVFKKATIVELLMFLKQSLEKQNLWNNEKIPKEFKTTGLQMIAENAAGSYRLALQTLEQCVDLEAFTEQDITNNLGIQNVVSFYEMMLQIMDGKATDGTFNLLIDGDYNTVFAYSYKVISDAMCYSTFKKIPGEYAYFIDQARNIAAHPKFPILLKHYQKLSEKTNPYLKKADYVIGICELIKECQNSQGVTPLREEEPRRVKRV